MGFIRPEVQQSIFRCRETIAGFLVAYLGLHWALNGVGFISIIGIVLTMIGGLFLYAGLQCARFRSKTESQGEGVVQVDERRVTYFGPNNGGSIAVSELVRIEIFPTEECSEWVLHDSQDTLLRIPTDAVGAEYLFDVFGGLDGMHVENMLHDLKFGTVQHSVVWQSSALRVH